MKQKTRFKQTEIGKIPENWKMKTISKLSFKITKGTTPTIFGGKFLQKGINFIKVEALNENGTINNSKFMYIDEITNKALSRSILEDNDILYSIAGTIGRVSIVDKTILPANLNQAIAIIRPNLERIDLKYFRYALINPQIKDYLLSKVVRAVQANLSLTEISNCPLPLPPLPEQKSIAKILSDLDAKIELNNKMNQILESIGQALFKKWFVDERKEEWRISKIGEELKTILGGTPDRTKPEYWNGNINWINSGKVNEFRILEPSEKITELGLKNSATKLLPRGSVVLAITGATLGQVSRLEIDTCANQSVIGIIENEKINSEYIYYWIKNEIRNIISHQTGGAQQHINKSNIDNYEILIPNKQTLENFNKLIKPIFKQISINCFQSQKLSQIRDLLLPKLMNGEIRVK